jgi:hypothetical protein
VDWTRSITSFSGSSTSAAPIVVRPARGRNALTTPVASDTTGPDDPRTFDAVTTTRSVCWTSSRVSA